MQKLEKRIATLEATSAPADEMTIIRQYVSPGHLDDEIFCLCDDHGNQWTRLPNETQQELKDRATQGVKRNAWGVAILIADRVIVSGTRNQLNTKLLRWNQAPRMTT